MKLLWGNRKKKKTHEEVIIVSLFFLVNLNEYLRL